MQLRLLPENLINQIAAGEVIERPSAVVKELVENAIDSGANQIEIFFDDGGKKAISVTDNGCGMSSADLSLAVQRHATSKLNDNNLSDVKFLGFRGEALPSIGAVSCLTITSRIAKTDHAWCIKVKSGKVEAPIPAALSVGTRVDVRDLFFTTPARLKFLKTARTEQIRLVEVVKQLAMAHPHIAFVLSDNQRQIFNLSPSTGAPSKTNLKRCSAIMGRAFSDNALIIDAERNGYHLSGYVGLPTLNRGNASMQFLFVNSRPVNDRILYGALRGAYRDFLASNRYPLVALFISAAPDLVDVNVHPAKTEVRFQDNAIVRGLIVSAIKVALAQAGHRASTTVADAALGAISKSIPFITSANTNKMNIQPPTQPLPLSSLKNKGLHETLTNLDHSPSTSSNPTSLGQEGKSCSQDFPLGAARGQLHETYIIAQSDDGIVIVDQHAAHERLVEERIKKNLASGPIKRQGLLIPEIVDLSAEDCDLLLSKANELKDFGLIIEKFGQETLIVRETPAMLGEINAKNLLQNLADDFSSIGEALTLQEQMQKVCATMACHSSVRAGRRLNSDEMNSLLREMEATPYSGQCSHGRPTYVELKLSDIEKLFGRR